MPENVYQLSSDELIQFNRTCFRDLWAEGPDSYESTVEKNLVTKKRNKG